MKSLDELVREREPDLDRLVRERDPLPADSQFYTALGELTEAGIRLAFERDGRTWR